jgi:plasmid replication initiation protein
MKDLYKTRFLSVAKANDLIQKSRFDLTLQQQKIVLFLISKIRMEDEEFKLYEFDIKEFSKVCGFTGNNYALIKESIKAIADKSLWVRLENGKETLLRWIEKPYIDYNKGVIQIRLDRDMKPYLLQIKKDFTKYELIWILAFSCKYSIRLYELISSIHYNELKEFKRSFTVDELKTLMGAETYKAYKDFRVRALEPAIEEINHYSNKSISYTAIKKGRSIEKIELTVSSKPAIDRINSWAEIERKIGIIEEE